jgi:hypothetical protein
MQSKIQKNKENEGIIWIEKIKDSHLKESIPLLISNKMINTEKINSTIEDFESNLKQEIAESFHEKYKDMNEIFSEIRKSGKELGVLNLKLMMIPLKIKIFLSTYEKKDAENIIKRIQEIEKEIGNVK